MSKLKCTCGNGMSNSNVPSINIINVFKEANVKSALDESPKVTLFDFETSDSDGFEYWYCQDCKRVHVVENIPNGTVVKRYQSVDSEKETSINGMEAIYVFSETEIYDAEEENIDLTLGDYIDQNQESHVYYIDDHAEKVYKKTEGTNGRLVYQIEK